MFEKEKNDAGLAKHFASMAEKSGLTTDVSKKTGGLVRKLFLSIDTKEVSPGFVDFLGSGKIIPKALADEYEEFLLCSSFSCQDFVEAIQVKGDKVSLHIRGDMTLRAEVARIPAHMTIDGSLISAPKNGVPSSLIELPAGLYVKEKVRIAPAPYFTTLPPDLVVQGDILVQEAGKLIEIPPTCKFGGSIDFYGCSGLRSFPFSRVNGTLNLSFCNSLEDLPDVIKVDGDFILWGSKNIKRLPREVTVGGSFNFPDCPLVNVIPDKMKVGKAVWAQGCALGFSYENYQKLLQAKKAKHINGSVNFGAVVNAKNADEFYQQMANTKHGAAYFLDNFEQLKTLPNVFLLLTIALVKKFPELMLNLREALMGDEHSIACLAKRYEDNSSLEEIKMAILYAVEEIKCLTRLTAEDTKRPAKERRTALRADSERMKQALKMIIPGPVLDQLAAEYKNNGMEGVAFLLT